VLRKGRFARQVLGERLELVPLEFEAVLGVVVVIGEIRARSPAGTIRPPTVWTWKLCDGLIVECSVHTDVEVSARRDGRQRALASVTSAYD
jgi:hypothetical protein